MFISTKDITDEEYMAFVLEYGTDTAEYYFDENAIGFCTFGDQIPKHHAVHIRGEPVCGIFKYQESMAIYAPYIPDFPLETPLDDIIEIKAPDNYYLKTPYGRIDINEETVKAIIAGTIIPLNEEE